MSSKFDLDQFDALLEQLDDEQRAKLLKLVEVEIINVKLKRRALDEEMRQFRRECGIRWEMSDGGYLN